jgi:hypothetical protein
VEWNIWSLQSYWTDSILVQFCPYFLWSPYWTICTHSTATVLNLHTCVLCVSSFLVPPPLPKKHRERYQVSFCKTVFCWHLLLPFVLMKYGTLNCIWLEFIFIWGFTSSGMWCYVIWWVLPDVMSSECWEPLVWWHSVIPEALNAQPGSPKYSECWELAAW